MIGRKWVFSVLVGAFGAAPAFAASDMVCIGLYKYGDGTIDRARVTAQVVSPTQLKDVDMKVWDVDPSKPNEAESVANVSADPDYRPRTPAYRNLNKFHLADGWTTYNLLLAKDLKPGRSRGVLQRTGHDGGVPINLSCMVSQD